MLNVAVMDIPKVDPVQITVVRHMLPTRRRCVTQKVRINGQTVHYSVGLYPDGTPGELFIEVAKAGSALRTWASEAGMMFSIALQHGTPLKTILDLYIGTRQEPCGPVLGHEYITQCTSIMDCIARDMAITYLHAHDYKDRQEDDSDAQAVTSPPALDGDGDRGTDFAPGREDADQDHS